MCSYFTVVSHSISHDDSGEWFALLSDCSSPTFLVRIGHWQLWTSTLDCVPVVSAQGFSSRVLELLTFLGSSSCSHESQNRTLYAVLLSIYTLCCQCVDPMHSTRTRGATSQGALYTIALAFFWHMCKPGFTRPTDRLALEAMFEIWVFISGQTLAWEQDIFAQLSWSVPRHSLYTCNFGI